MAVAGSVERVCILTAEEDMFVECAAAVGGADPDRSLTVKALIARRDVEVVEDQRDQAILERTDPGLEERQVGRRSSLESEARIQTIRATGGRMTGPCEDWGEE